METISDHASEGGKARAKALTSAERSEIARHAVQERWRRAGKGGVEPARATDVGILRLGAIEIPCAVLHDETRVFSERGVTKALGGKRGGSHWKRMREAELEGGAKLPVYLSANNLKPFIDLELASALSSPIPYTIPGAGGVAYGLDARLLPAVCNVLLKARDAGKLTEPQERLAVQADIITRGFAEVGVIALVDEATGYQDKRARDALAKILEAFVATELRKWVSTFSADYYKELCRLQQWPFKESLRLPRYAGKLTDDLVYKRLAPGVRDELRNLNPTDETKRRKAKHFQWLTEDLGYPKLQQHVAAVTALMKASDDWSGFTKMIDRALPRCPEMPLFDASD